MSLHALCERHGVDEQRLARWAKIFPAPAKFAEVVVVGEIPISKPSSLVIEVGQARVRVNHNIDDRVPRPSPARPGSIC